MRLVTFGCSHTFGEGITEGDDCYEGAQPSLYSWPSVLGKKIGSQVLNYGEPGASNNFILNTIRQHAWKSNDVAVILFTYPTRYTHYVDNRVYDNILPNRLWAGRKTPANKYYYKSFTNYHIEKTNLIDIEHAYLFLKYNNIPFVSRFTKELLTDARDEMSPDVKRDMSTTLSSYADTNFKGTLLGHDGAHYSIQVHDAWAKALVKPIRKIIKN
jgi:hypothetical protein